MTAFIGRRLFQAFCVALLVAFFAFAATEFVGDPLLLMLGSEATPAERAEMAAALGLDRPFLVRFADYLGGLVQGDFGVSYRTREPVLDMILARLPASVELSVTGILLALAIGLPVGMICGIFPNGWMSQALMGLAVVGVSLPVFLIGIFLILIFSVTLGWLPSFGRGTVTMVGGWPTGLLTADGLRAIVLPAVTLSLFLMTLIVRLVRGEMMEVMREDYIRFAIARGLPTWRVWLRHGMRNAMGPVVTVVGLQLGTVLVFAMITETVFSWPGIGQLMILSIGTADLPVITTYLVLSGVLFVAMNLIVDIAYMFMDPRVRIGGAA